jgi:hypothetical protein
MNRASICFVALLAAVGLQFSRATPPIATNQASQTEILVKFKGAQLLPNMNAMGIRNQEAILLSSLPNEGRAALSDVRGAVVRVSSQTGIAVIRPGIPIEEAISILEASGSVMYAEPNYRIHVGASRVPSSHPIPSVGSANPNDPSFGLQWGLNNKAQIVGGVTGEAGADIKALAGWSTRTDASTTIIAVMGTGIDYTHNDLKSNIWKNPGETCGNNIDDDHDGYVDDCYGVNTYLNNGNPMDDNGVGTHMAGIAGASGNNALGVTGVAWKAKLMALKFLDEDGWGWSADAVEAINYALAMQSKYTYHLVMLMPVMGGSYSKALYDAINTAMTKGVLVVAGASDGFADVDQWPAYPAGFDLANIISVTSSDAGDYNLYGFNYGAISVDLAAPGQNIYSTWITNNYKLQSGSNSAASFVAGAAALTWSQHPTYNWKQVKATVVNGAEDGLHVNYWYGDTMTEGRLNLNNTLTTASSAPAIFSVTPEVTNLGEVVTINGINFGTTKATVGIVGQTYVFPASAIVGWVDEKITLKLPTNSPAGQFRLMVKTAGGTSRGALVRFRGPSSDQWVYPTWMGTTLMQHEEAAWTQVGNDIWIISGRSNYEQTASVERFSLLTMRGQVNPDWEIPKAVRRAGAAAIGTKIYVAGGFDDVTQKWQSTLQIFDTTTGIWTRGHNLPAPLDEPSVVMLGNKIWVMGGRSPNNTGLKTTYLYDPAANSWTTKALLPLKTAYASAVVPPAGVAGPGVAAGAKIWLLSGYNESGGTFTLNQNVLEYDVASNAWSIRDDIPLVGQHGAGGGIVIGNKAFCLYGNGDWGAGEWISSYSKAWVRHVGWPSGMGNYSPMVGKVGNYIYLVAGSMARNVYRIYTP